MADEMRKIELLTISDEKSRNKEGAGRRIVVVQWIKDNKMVGSLQLCKFDYYVNPNDKKEYAKIKGFNLGDIQAVFGPREGKPSVWVEQKIAALMKNPPEVKPVAKAEAPKSTTTEDIEEVPF